MSDTVARVKERLSIVDVVSQYVKLQRAGTILKARCPFHAEKTPSFVVSPERGTYHCFGCGVGGDVFTFVQEIEGVDFKGALKMLAERAGVPLVYERKEGRDETGRLFELMEAATVFYASRLPREAREYLSGRGLDEKTMQAFRLGYAGEGWSDASLALRERGFSEKELLDAGISKKNERGSLTDKFRNRIMFPIADTAGRVVAFSGRIFGEHASPEAPKYLNSPETALFKKSRILYGFDRAKQAMRKLDCAILVEGQMDLLLSHKAGWTNTVAVSGTAFTPEHASIVQRMTDNLVIALDADEAGVKAAGKAARAALRAGMHVKVARLPEGSDPADLILAGGPDAWKKAIREATDVIHFLLDVLGEKLQAEDRFRRAVESIVLPFLADVQSPIAREQYVREVAKRLHVSESAVLAGLKAIPREASDGDSPLSSPTPATRRSALSREEQAYGLLLLLESAKEPALEPALWRADLRDTIGAERLAVLDALPGSRKEELRFGVERVYGEKGALKGEADILVKILRKERLTRELSEAAIEIERAEAAGDEGRVEELKRRCQLLTGEIARLHTVW